MTEQAKPTIYDLIIIGAGTAGLTAALYALRSGNTVLIIEESVQGGQIISTPEVANFPGLPNISGVDYAQALFAQVEELGLKMAYEKVAVVDLAGTLKVIETAKNVYKSKTVIIATGVKRRHLDCPGESKFTGRGVSYCATCDGAFHKNKVTAVVGGGNTALEDALYLTKMCEKVHLIHRRSDFRGQDILAAQVVANPKIEIHYNCQVVEVAGASGVESLKIKDIASGEETTLGVSGVFVAIGAEPQNQLFDGKVLLDDFGYVLADEDCHTNLQGVFVAGDTRTKLLRQLVTAAADGAVAATEAAKYISEKMPCNNCDK